MKALSRDERQAAAADAVSKLGAKPIPTWIDKHQLEVEPEYQRELSQKRSQSLIASIAENWCWVHASVLIVAKIGKNRWVIIDGQHRHQAALRRDDITEVLCLVVDAQTVQERARAFVAHNRDRVTLNFISLFHADVKAGDAKAQLVVDACQEAGVIIPRSPKTTEMLEPNETMAVGAMGEIAAKMGKDALVTILQAVKAAYPGRGGQMRSGLIKAAAAVTNLGVAPDVVTAALSKTSCAEIDLKARTEERVPGRSLTQAFAEVVAKLCGTTTVRPPAERVRRRKVKNDKRARPFHFDRSQPAKAALTPTPVVSRDSADKVRRFEAGDMMALVTKALESKGHKLERHRGSRPFKLDGKPVTFEDVVSAADKIRAKNGQPPLRKAS